MTQEIDARIANRLKSLRLEKGWSLEELANRSDVSRASLSRLEKGDVSPTTETLARLCSAHGLTMTRLISEAEQGFTPLIQAGHQEEWLDDEAGYLRRSVSPPSQQLAGEVIRGHLQNNREISYENPPRPGLEHHLVMLAGHLTLQVNGESHQLATGDCLRYQLHGPSHFSTGPDSSADYLLFMI